MRKALPRGAHSHLYACVTVTSNREASTGSHPSACVRSAKLSAPVRAHAASTASASACSPVADCTSENATSHVRSSIASASAVRGTSLTRTPLFACAWKGATMDAKSPSTQTTSAPSGAEAATREASTETWDPMGTSSAPTPAMRAKAARDRAIAAS